MAEPNYATSTGAESRPISTNIRASTGNGNAAADDNLNMGGRASMFDTGYHPRVDRSGPDMFVVVTFLLSLIAWIVVIVAQAFTAVKYSNELVRILWFGVVIQTILSIVVFKIVIGSRSYDAAYAYGMQVAILSSLACVFAVMGVDRTIYITSPAPQAVGAGWLILAIIDLLWVIYFTSPPQSPVGRLLSNLRSTKKEEEESHVKVEKIGRSTDAFAMSPVHGGGSAQRMSGATAPDGGQSLARPVVPQMWNERRTTYASQSDGAGGGGGAATTTGPASEPGAASERNASGSAKAEPEPEPGVEPEPEPEPEPEARWKAEALYDYAGSKDDPNELAFKKGQILQILDKSGKWWFARTKDGKKGITPSNYLRLL